MRAATLTSGLLATLLCLACSSAPKSTNGGYTLPAAASLTEGVWRKGDLHVHSCHSRDSSNNPVAKILALADQVGMDYLLISDHDNHVQGDVAHNTWADPQFKSDSVLLLYGAEWTTDRGRGTAIAFGPYDHQRLYDVRDQRDVVIARVKQELGIHLSANHPSGKDHFGCSTTSSIRSRSGTPLRGRRTTPPFPSGTTC